MPVSRTGEKVRQDAKKTNNSNTAVTCRKDLSPAMRFPCPCQMTLVNLKDKPQGRTSQTIPSTWSLLRFALEISKKRLQGDFLPCKLRANSVEPVVRSGP
jgi:hypothetical protein